MRILFFGALASLLIIGLIYELDHGLARGHVSVPEQPKLNEIIKPARN